jgi:hypothetical protein
MSAMETFAFRCLWFALLPPVSFLCLFDNGLELRSLQGLVVMELLENFLNVVKLSENRRPQKLKIFVITVADQLILYCRLSRQIYSLTLYVNIETDF